MDPVENVRVRARENGVEVERDDALAVEEPLSIRVRPGEAGAAVSFVTTMRTPGHDEELAAGLLLAEGVLEDRSDLLAVGRPTDPRTTPEIRENVVVASLSSAAYERAAGLQRATVMGSACGVCGKTTIENVIPAGRAPLLSRLRLAPRLLETLPGRLRERQSIFARTGGLHAAGLFSSGGALREVREDIGRHNATDKLIGAFFLRGELPLSESVLLVSGRAGFEIVQKAFQAGIPVIASISAPSSLAVALAESGGITLIGFLRGERFNVYSGAERVATSG